MNVPKRLLVTAAIVLGSYAAVQLLVVASTPAQVDLPPLPLSSISRTLGEWQAEDVELDSRMYQSIGAVDVLTRVYTNSRQQQVSVFLAVYDDHFEGLIHQPPVCYRASGYELGADRSDSLPRAGGEGELNVQWVEARRRDDSVLCLYWFELGGQVVGSRYDLAAVKRGYWGASSWPALIKVMLDAPAGGPRAEANLRELGQLVAAEISRISSPPVAAGSSPAVQ